MLDNTYESEIQGECETGRPVVDVAALGGLNLDPMPPLEELLGSVLDIQIGGDHYKKLGEYQPWEVLARWLTPDELRGFAKGTVIAYLARERDKGGLQDVMKSLHTLQLFEEMHKVCCKFHGENHATV